MQTTEHYELNLAEGTDTVNPLVIDVPNYETIDEAMYTNYLGTVGLATELLSGSVHALTREGSTPMFRFTATADWTAGDTVTVDGTQVTAKLPTGAALGTGAYVINSEVLCCLQGTLLTFYVPAGSVTTADDSLKLGGELPEYYGTASAVQTATNVANAASLLVDQLSSNLTENYYTKTEVDNLLPKEFELIATLTNIATNATYTIPNIRQYNEIGFIIRTNACSSTMKTFSVDDLLESITDNGYRPLIDLVQYGIASVSVLWKLLSETSIKVDALQISQWSLTKVEMYAR